MFHRSSRTIEEPSQRRFDSSIRSMSNDEQEVHPLPRSSPSAEAPSTANPRGGSGGGGNGGGPRFFRRHGSQPSLLMHGVPGLLSRGLGGGSSSSKAKKRSSPPPKSSQLSLSTTSLTTSSPSASPYVVDAGPAPVTPPSQRSPAKKKVNRRPTASDNSSPPHEYYAEVPRIIMGPPILSGTQSYRELALQSVVQAKRNAKQLHGSGGGSGSRSAGSSSGVSSSAGGSSGRTSSSGTNKASSRPNIYVPHLNDTVSSFNKAQDQASSTSTPPPPVMDYCHHVREVARHLPPFVAGTVPASRPSKPNLLPSDEAWLSSSKDSDHYTARKSRSEDEDTDINDDEYGDEYDDKSGSMCDTLHNSLGNDDSYRPRRMRMPVPPPAHERADSMFGEDSLFNESSVGTNSFKLPGPYSVCDDSLHNSSSMGASSYRRRFDREMDEDGEDYDYENDEKYDDEEDEISAVKAIVTVSLVGAPVTTLHEKENEGGANESNDDDDEQSLSPEEAVEVIHHRHSTNTRAPTATEAARSSPSATKDVGGTTNSDRESGSIIEIFPGCKVPLLGCRETWGSFREGTAVLVPCSSCLNCVYCVPVATMVLCPHCRDISPLATTVENQNSEASVGLGMSVHESKAFLDA